MTLILPSIRSAVGCIRVLIGLLICVAIARDGQTQTFEIDNDHTSLVFAVSHSGLSYTYGRFNECSGEISIGKIEKLQSFIFTIDARSIDTNNKLRDDHLKGPDFFDVQAFPKIEFRSVKLTSDGDDFMAKGILAMHGVKKDITIRLTKIGIGRGPRGKARAGFFSKFSVKRSDFGIKSLPTIIGNQIAITLSFEGILKSRKRDKTEVKDEDKTEDKAEDSLDGSIEGNLDSSFFEGSFESLEQSVGLQDEFQILDP